MRAHCWKNNGATSTPLYDMRDALLALSSYCCHMYETLEHENIKYAHARRYALIVIRRYLQHGNHKGEL
jgi:hypothetical protein